MMSSSSPPSFHPYHDPPIITILIQSSFLLCLNIANTLVDRLLFCGLLGQVFVGVAWGTAGAGWLPWDVEEIIVQLGYLGLILIVYEGGLSTNIRSVRANLMLSTMVAITGIAVPISLSFTLQSLLSATPLQAFAAGAALCSTSLGTTFTLLSASGLANTRLGTVLSTAAMMDDVVGLVMVQVISNLGGASNGNGSSFDVATVLRALGVSFGFAVFIPLVCWGVVRPGTIMLQRIRKRISGGFLENWVWHARYTPFVIHTLVLLGLVAGASFAGTSNLLAAYLAGAAISWWDLEHEGWDSQSGIEGPSDRRDAAGVAAVVSDTPPLTPTHEDTAAAHDISTESATRMEREIVKSTSISTGNAVYEKYYAAAVQRILKPFFFASIGFAIPISKMFTGDIVWRGIIYTVLMLFGKLVTGLWLVRFSIPIPRFITKFNPRSFKVLKSTVLASYFRFKKNSKQEPQVHSEPQQMQNLPPASQEPNKKTETQSPADPLSHGRRTADGAEREIHDRNINPSTSPQTTTTPIQPPPQSYSTAAATTTPQPPPLQKPLSLYPASILGTAMTARGEIGFLIASIASSEGIFAPSPSQKNAQQSDQGFAESATADNSSGASSSAESSRLYLVVIWAIVLCTVVGPVGVGVLVRRVRRLQGGKDIGGGGGRGDPLGVWGVG